MGCDVQQKCYTPNFTVVENKFTEPKPREWKLVISSAKNNIHILYSTMNLLYVKFFRNKVKVK